VQWSGNPLAAREHAWGFAAPYNLSTQFHVVAESGDYFTLTWTGNDLYLLTLFDGDGIEKLAFPEGKVKADSEVVFYLVNGWYATIITTAAYNAGDSADFSHLIANPSQAIMEAALSPSCVGFSRTPNCHRISPNRVWDVQWSGNPLAAREHAWGFAAPYNLSTQFHVVAESGDYFTLTWTGNDLYLLTLFDCDGIEKLAFPEGKVKADSEVVFYLVNGRYATIITTAEHNAGDSADFSHLVANPSQAIVESSLGLSCLNYLV